MAIEDARREYQYGRLMRDSLRDCPFEQFQLWLDQAVSSDIVDPTAMAVTTVDADARPWTRAVLLKGFDSRGFVFFTNLGSRKAASIARNHHVSLHFPWFRIERQVSVSGTAEQVARAEVEKYFASRPRDSQIAAWASRQSAPLESRQALEAEFAAIEQRFAGGEVPTPEFWGGYRVTPAEFQFWQGGENRLHDRYQYLQATADAWRIQQLAP